MAFDGSGFSSQRVTHGQQWIQRNPTTTGGCGVSGIVGIVLLTIGILGLTGVLNMSAGVSIALTVVGAVLGAPAIITLALLACCCGAAIICCPCLTSCCFLGATSN